MSDIELTTAISDYREYKRMQEDLEKQMDTIKTKIQEHMSSLSVDILSGMDWKVTWKDTTRTTIDSKALKKDLPEVAEKYSKTTVSKRFVVS